MRRSGRALRRPRFGPVAGLPEHPTDVSEQGGRAGRRGRVRV